MPHWIRVNIIKCTDVKCIFSVDFVLLKRGVLSPSLLHGHCSVIKIYNVID